MSTCHQVLIDSQWEIDNEIVCNSRKCKYILLAYSRCPVLYLSIGSQWRNIPDNYPPWETICYYFQK